MALNSQQLPGGINGGNPLIYQGSTPNLIVMTRQPTPADVQPYAIGYWWIIPITSSFPTGEIWVLVSKAQNIATWKRLHGGTPPVSSFYINKIFLTTTGSGTYTPTAGMVQCYVECQGGGSGAGGSDSLHSGNNYSGSSGGYAAKLFQASDIGSGQLYTVGTGGAGAANGNSAPGNGGTSTFGSFLTATGGIAGYPVQSSSNIYPAGGSASGGSINIAGQPGLFSLSIEGGSGGYTLVQYPGANSLLGLGGNPPVVSSYSGSPYGAQGRNATGYGAGGGGAGFSTPNISGGNGSQGVIIITEYIG